MARENYNKPDHRTDFQKGVDSGAVYSNTQHQPTGSAADKIGQNIKQQSQQSGPSNGCFPAGTKISTGLGTTKPIEKLGEGDKVLSVNRHTGRVELAPILRVPKHKGRTLWLLELEDGRVIRTTGVHSFRTSDGWRKASCLKSGDMVSVLESTKQRLVRVESSERGQRTETVYNLIVGSNFNFVADGALCHSFTYFRRLKAAVWTLLSALSAVRSSNRSIQLDTA